MTKKEKFILWIGIAAIVVIVIYPPVGSFKSTQDSSGVIRSSQTVYYKFLFTESANKILWDRLFLQCLLVSIISGGVLVTLVSTREQNRKLLVQQISELAVEKEKLQHEIIKINRICDERKKQQKLLEERSKQKNSELMTANTKLQEQIAEHKYAEELFTERITELTKINDKLHNRINECRQIEQRLNDQTAESAPAIINECDLPKELNETIEPDDEAIDIKRLLDPQKLKELANLANQLNK